jgi:4-carboxymuconolactone decarboxylase
MEHADSDNSTRERGRLIRERAQGAKAPQLGRALEDLEPVLLEWTDSYVFGTVWARPGLAYEERMLVAITSLASLGNLSQLRNYFHGALQDGMPAEKINEAILMLGVYAGFPVMLNAMVCWKEVLNAHERRQSD